jgi:uncharacterized protein YgiM (DUF1202 family)
MPLARVFFPIAILVFASACKQKTPVAPSIAEAFVAPATLTIRTELSPRSTVAATIKHGEKVDILQVRRRFIKIRTKRGVEGWTDNRQLMTTKQMDALRQLIEAAAKLPSQGRGTVFEALNVHTEPNRQSPSYCQVPENGSADVVARRILPRVPYQSEVVSAPPPTPKKASKKKEEKKEKASKIPPPPRPAPPKVPDNWLDLSRRDALLDSDPKKAVAGTKTAPEIKYDEWVLIRTKEGNAGWVLARMVSMAIPDDVAQYAEGSRITGYFSLGDVKDADDKPKHHWLWTTLSRPLESYQFDGFRVFIFNTRRNRYETAYRERDLKGYYPVETMTVEVTEGKNHFKAPGFALIVEDDNGQAWKRTFAFLGYRVRALSKEPWKKPAPFESPKAGDDSILNLPAQAEAQAVSWWQRTKAKVGGWFGKK